MKQMRAGLVVSSAAHAAVLAWGLLNLHSASPIDASEIEQIPVDFVEITDETKIMKGSPVEKVVAEIPVPQLAEKPIEAPPKPAPPAPDPEPAPPPPPPPPPPPEPTPPPPEPAPPEPEPTPPPPEEAPAPSPEAETPPPPDPKPQVAAAKDVPAPKLRPRPQKTVPSIDDLTAEDAPEEPRQLLDRDSLEQLAMAEPTEAPPTVGTTNGITTATMTASELDALRARLMQCWTMPIGWSDPSEVRVVLMINLNADGSVAGEPQVLESPQGQFSLAAPESAVRAVRRCQPYTLPAEKYDAWKEVKVTFDPRDVSGL